MIRYKKLGYVALNVSDVEKTSKFYEEIVGLTLQSKVANGPAFLRCSRDHHNIVLYQGGEPGLKRIGLEVENPDQLDIAFEHFTRLGLNPQEVDRNELRELKQARSIRIKDPNAGVTFELYSDITQVAREFQPTVANIARLGHIVLNIEKFEEFYKFMTEVMNFRTSDYIHDTFAFMRCYPNPYHHTFAFGRSKANSLHHVNFMVTDIDDIGIATNRLKKNDTTIVFGPGKHDPSGSIFLYWLDPDGLTVEYSFGMEKFPESGERKARLLDSDIEIIDKWGGRPDPRMASKGAIE